MVSPDEDRPEGWGEKGTQRMNKTRNRKPDELAYETQQQRFVGWELYQENLRSGMDEQEAVRQALLKVLPRGAKGSDNHLRELELWKKHKLWPPPEIEGHDQPGTLDRRREASSDKPRSSDAVRHRDARSHEALSEADILGRAKEILMRGIDVAERPTTAKGRKSTLKTVMMAARFPSDLVAELEALGGRKSHHLEKALKLYLKIVKLEQN